MWHPNTFANALGRDGTAPERNRVVAAVLFSIQSPFSRIANGFCQVAGESICLPAAGGAALLLFLEARTCTSAASGGASWCCCSLQRWPRQLALMHSSTPGHRHAPAHRSGASEAKHHAHGLVPEAKHSERVVGPRIPLAGVSAAEKRAPAQQLPPDLAGTKQAIELVRHRKFGEATTLAATIGDPVARNLVEWTLLRDSDSPGGFDRYAAFVQANTHWPSISMLRRRAEARLWQERRDAATVRRFLGGQPTSALGRLALARVLQGEGDRAGARREVRAVWQSAEMSAELEAAVVETFPDSITSVDRIARMDRRIGAKDFSAAMRSAKHLGAGHVANR